MKGEQLEEKLREHFLSQGSYVVRGILFTYDDFEITDIDLWVYNKQSSWTRERTIVDIKNKKTPQAIERIFWTKGLMSILRVNNCMVATTDRRPSVKQFGKINNVIVLDGLYLDTLKEISGERLTEEEFAHSIRASDDPKFKDNWYKKYCELKTTLVKNLDYGGCNYMLNQIKYFLKETCTNTSKRYEACRLSYLCISYLMIILDFLLKDSSYIDEHERLSRINDGLKFGNLGKAGIEKTIDLAIKITGAPSYRKKEFFNTFDSLNTNILNEYFSKTDNIASLYVNAKQFEKIAYDKVFYMPNDLPNSLKGLIGLLLDYAEIDRRQFFNVF